jgi:hypothetical protein
MQVQIIEVFGDLLLHIVERLERGGGFDGILGGGRGAVESQVLMELISGGKGSLAVSA